MSERDELLSVPVAAKRLGVSYQTLRGWLKDGTFDEPVVKPGRQQKIPASSIRAYLQKRTTVSGQEYKPPRESSRTRRKKAVAASAKRHGYVTECVGYGTVFFAAMLN